MSVYFRNSNGQFIQIPAIPGKSAYEIAVERGVFQGTEEEFAKAQVIENKEIIDQITQEKIDKWDKGGDINIDMSSYATKEYVDEAINGVDVTEQLKEYAKLVDLDGLFDDVALNEQETTDSQTAIDFYSNGEVVKTVYFSGGSGTSATSAYISTELPENVLVSTGENFDLKLDFSSPNLGKGTLKVFINDVDAVSTSIGQGESTTPISGDLFSKGQNKVVVYVLDRVGVMSNSLTFYVRYGSLEITSDFDAYSSYDHGSIVRYYFTPIAVDTSLALTMYMSIDGQTQTGVSCTSDTRGYFTFPSNLSVGNHLCKAWVQDSNGSLSNELVFNLIILDDTSLVVASDTQSVSIEEGEQLSLDYKVYMKGNSTFNVYVYVDNTQVSTGTCGLTTSYYKTSSLSLGLHTVKVEVFDLTNTVSDYVTWTVNITESSYEMKTPVTAGATFIASAKNKSNQDENREVWIGTDQDGNDIEVPLVNFSWNEESGWANDQLIISGNSYAEIPIKPLATNAKYGFTLDIEFLTRPIGVEDALVLDLWDEENNCGIKITTEELIMQSKAGNRCDLYFEEDTIVSAMFVIDRNEGTAKIYLDGVMCEAFHLTDYEVNGVDYLEDFTVDKNIKLGGSGYCAIRNIRTYQVALTTNEIINNFISNKIVKSEQRALVEFQKGTDLPTMTIYCDFSGLGKDDKKPCNISYVSTDVNKYGESFTLDGKYSQLQYQGTSSMAYPIKNYRINPRDKNGKKKINPFIGGKPESRFTLKADFITSNHAHNTGMAKFISDKLYNYNDEDESTMNPMRWHLLQNGGDVNTVRETINGFPIRLILINDGSTTLNEGQAEPTPGNTKDMGIFNFNNDKDNLNTMGMDTEIFPNCLSYEVTANSDTSAGAFVPYGEGSEAEELEYLQNSFELRYPDEDDVGKDYGYLGMEKESEDYYIKGFARKDHNYPALCIPIEPNTEYTFSTDTNANVTLAILSENKIVITTHYNYSNGKVFTTPNNARYIATTLNKNIHTLTLNQTYIFDDELIEGVYTGNSLESLGDKWVSTPYKKRIISQEYGLKRVIDWVGNCTDEEFVADFDKYFNRHYTLRYYLLVVLMAGVDNLGKNMMLDTWDGQIWYPRFYDIDTILSYDNSGEIKFDVDIEMEQGYWNTSSSRLWTKIRDLMHDELVEVYKDMRANGVTYEDIMHYMYDEQIAKIPQTYYNMDYDVKYAPYADEYLGKAHGDGYQHMKRWLKKRFIFCDTLYDYAPSYNNDVLTIRANTLNEMNLTIETYTPLYQHVSFYNGNMEKIKITPGQPMTFKGFAQTETDQEVLIYGGSNIKKITGIQSMNPNSMLIGGATRLTELDISNCPILTIVNSNKANFSPHIYLNKLNMSNCPQLGGNLNVSNSPLLQEIDARNSAITGLLLPTSLRNLEVMRLPNTIQDLTLYDVPLLHTIELDEGNSLQNLSLSNCSNLTNCINFDLTKVPSISLDNSFDTEELYMSETTNLTLKNMPSLKRVIFTPNSEYSAFDINNVLNGANYKITTFNNPMMTDFITTAPQRLSYKNGEYGDITPNTVFTANTLDLADTQFQNVKFLCTTDVYNLKVPTTMKNFYCDSAMDIDTDVIEDASYEVIHEELIEPYTTNYNKNVYRYTETEVTVDIVAKIENDEIEYGSLNDTTGVFETGVYPSILLEVTPGSDMTLQCTWIKAGKYDKNMNYLGNIGWASDTTITIPSDTYYVRPVFYGDSGWGTITYPFVFPYTPNIIPSSANGSLIFNMYSNNTTQPTSTSPYMWDLTGLKLEDFYTFGMNNWIKQDENNNITMPQRMPGYSVRLVNADITPNEYPTMLYPKLIDTTLPITGKLDYTKYNGTSLAWAYAYTTGDVSINPLDSGSIRQITQDYNKLYGTDFVDVADVWVYKDTDTSKLSTNEAITKAYIELTSDNYKTRVNEVLQWYPNCTDLYFFEDGSVTTLENMFQPANTLNNLNNGNNRLYWEQIQKITFMDGYFENTGSLNRGFQALKNLQSIHMPSNVTLLYYAFEYCSNLQNINQLPNTLQDIRYAFAECRALTQTPTIPNGITSMRGTFANCTSLTTAPAIPQGVTDMGYTFNACKALTQAPTIPNSVTNIDRCFQDCIALTTSPVIPSSVTNMASTFYGCTSLTTPPVIPSSVTNMEGTFSGCSALKTAPTIPQGVTDMGYTFNACKALTQAPAIPQGVTNMYETFRDCTSLTQAPTIPNGVTNMTSTFYGCTALTTVDFNGFDPTGTTFTSIFNGCTSLKTVRIDDWTNQELIQAFVNLLPVVTPTSYVYTMYNVTVPSGWAIHKLPNPLCIAEYTATSSGVVPTFNSEYTGYTTNQVDNGNGTYTTTIMTNSLDNLPTRISFKDKSTLTSVEYLNTKNLTTMSEMFRSCSALTSLDLSSFDTSNVTDMDYMFYNCYELTSLDLSSFNTSEVIYMNNMFYNCYKLTSLDLSSFNTSKVTHMNNMFYNCYELTSLGLSNFNTSSVTSMGSMFYSCSNLTSLDLSSFNTSEVTNMSWMFRNCSGLTSLDLSSFDTSKVTNMSRMFGGCNALETLYSMKNIGVDLDLGTTKLNATSSLDVINNLKTVSSGTLTLGSTLLAKLTDEQKAIAINKGWTLV